jgi:hypothetical protein
MEQPLIASRFHGHPLASFLAGETREWIALQEIGYPKVNSRCSLNGSSPFWFASDSFLDVELSCSLVPTLILSEGKKGGSFRIFSNQKAERHKNIHDTVPLFITLEAGQSE